MPTINLSPTRVKSGDWIYLTGTGFIPNKSAMSHLIRPDNSEYNPIRLRTNEKGEVAHKIDTVMLDVGTFQIWLEDEASNKKSNRVEFTVDSSFTHP